MSSKCKTITLPLPFRLGSVNCYLLETNDGGYILIDNGGSNKREELEETLEREGCKPGNLKLIIITHGDFDHTGNASYLRNKYGVKIAMNHEDSEMVERGNMFSNRKTGNIFSRKLIGVLTPILFRFGKSERFMPDCYLDDGYDLSGYGLDAKVVNIPGHSKGSIGILTVSGDLFCGDLLVNEDKTDKPSLNSIVDDKVAMDESIKSLKGLRINTVYPGHGKPFSWDKFIHLYSSSN
ncbi:MBL fold metallo-hydrolase [Chloroflexota bacterium]